METNTKTGEAGLKVSTTCSRCEGSGSDELGRCLVCKGDGFADQPIESLMLEVALERSSHNITCLRLTAAEEFIERLAADGVLTKEEIRRWGEIKARKYRSEVSR
jgi:DnaJ-class molecular chaperone